MADDIAQVFADALAPDPSRPLLTWYDDTTGDRAELSGATLANWVAKTANLLVDGAGLAPGDRAGVLLPPHWQTAAVLLGCWSARLSVELTGPTPVDVIFAAADRLDAAATWPADDRYALALAPLAAPLRTVPPTWTDYVVEVRGHGDHHTPYPESGPADADLVARAARRATQLGLSPGDRVLIDAERHPDPVDWLLAPLTVGASVVLCGGLDRNRLPARLTAERVQVNLA
nr:TIGR03089 family protein [Micromonospora sp. DSM 115978]